MADEPFGTVARHVPRGFPAYVRLPHPAEDLDGRPSPWSRVARHSGRTVHSLVQWHALVRSSDAVNATDSVWPGNNPRRGRLAAHVLANVVRTLRLSTGSPDDCWMGVWDGNPAPDRGGHSSSPPPAEQSFTKPFASEQLRSPRLVIGNRAYLLFRGELERCVEFAEQAEDRSPNLLWPADRAWFLATEVDFDSTLVGGAMSLVDALSSNRALEAWGVQPDDCLAADCDLINVDPI